jgi:hypothetical protein
VLGASDGHAAHPASASYTPADLGATLLRALGVPADAEIRDLLDQPFRVNTGTPIPWGG